jgi:hypothetical protein
MRWLCVPVLLFAVGVFDADATTYLVKPDGTGDFPTIQAAIYAASDGDVIELADGVFSGFENQDVNFMGKLLTVRSQGGNPETCIVDCQGTPESPHRGFVFANGEGEGARLEGITVRNGYGPRFGAMNRFVAGAVLCCEGAMPTLERCVFAENAGQYGGAVVCYAGAATLRECIFTGNHADDQHGGGLYISRCDPVIRGCSFIGNTAAVEGGGACCYKSRVRFSRCVFAGNSSPEATGGLSTLYYSSVSVDTCTFMDNQTGMYGGGLGCQYQSQVDLRNCTLSSNRADEGQGASLAIFANCKVVLENTIVAFAPRGGSIFVASGCSAWLDCCDIYGNTGGDWIGAISTQYGIRGNICEDPLFCGELNPEAPCTLDSDSPCAPLSPPNPECDLIGAWPVACGAMAAGGSQGSAAILGVRRSLSVDRTELRLCLPESDGGRPLTLGIHDCTGRGVRMLIGGSLPAGEHHLAWDGTDAAGRRVPSGVYYVVMTLGSRMETVPIVRIR